MKIALKILIAGGMVLALRGPSYAGSGRQDGSGVFDSVIVEEEFGPLYIFQNDGRYGPDGTRFTASDVGQDRNLFPGRRTSVELRFQKRHSLILLYAPLDITTYTVLEDDLQFRDTLFTAGTQVEHRYLFEGYRASYLYGVFSGERTSIDVGGTVQIRNAEVSFRETAGGLYDTENDIGLVFALKSRLRYFPWESGAWVMFEADGFSTFGLLGDEVRGAIYDLRLLLGLPVVPGADLIFGGRLIGGGAEVRRRDIDNWGNYGSFTAGFRFDLVKLFGSNR